MGPDAVGPPRYPLRDALDDKAKSEAEWRTSLVDGRVLLAADDEINEIMRDGLASLGINPDANPYESTLAW